MTVDHCKLSQVKVLVATVVKAQLEQSDTDLAEWHVATTDLENTFVSMDFRKDHTFLRTWRIVLIFVIPSVMGYRF